MNYLAFLALIMMCAGPSLAAAKNNSLKSCCKSIKKELKRIGKPSGCCECEPICQKKINKAGGTLILYKSGNYALTENVVGRIIVAADSVCIDLCCHILNAGGASNAIIDNGHMGLEVYNGSIVGSSSAGISVTNCDSVELYDLTMTGHLLDAIFETGCTDVSIHDVNFLNNNSGERALHFDTCDNISVKNCNASGFLSTIGAVIQLDTCNAASIQDVDVTNCTKAQAAPVGSFDTSAALVNMNTCTGVDLERVKVNNNTVNTTAVGNRRFSGIGFVFSNSCSMHECETSNNVDINGDNGNDLTNFGSLDRQVFVGESDNVVITAHQANNNSCTQPILAFRAIHTRDSNNTVLDGCQTNSNFVQELAVSPLFSSDMHGILIQVVNGSNGNAIRNCQANFNQVANAPANPNEGLMRLIAIEASATVVDNCQANNNSMGSSEFNTYVLGLFTGNEVQDVTFSHCTADNNVGGELAIGIIVVGDIIFNAAVTDCSASSNGNFGLLLLNDGTTPPGSNIEVVRCTFSQNGGDSSVATQPFFGPVTAGGIVMFNRDAFEIVGDQNVLIEGCQIYDTFSTNDTTGFPVGIYCNLNKNVVIKDTNVFNTTTASSLGGHGILFDSLTDSKIIRTQVHGNQNSGIEIVGDNSTLAIIECIALDNDIGVDFASGSTASCSLVQDSRALSNTTAGFNYDTTPFTVTFIGNEAQCNGECVDDNFAGLNTLINLQELSWTNGAITNVNPVGPGEAAIGARFTNLRQGVSCSP